MSANAAVRFPEPDDFRPRELPRLVPDDDGAGPPTQDAPSFAPPGVVPPDAVASAELPRERPHVRGIRPPPVTAPHWRVLHVAAGAACAIFLVQVVLLCVWLLSVAR